MQIEPQQEQKSYLDSLPDTEAASSYEIKQSLTHEGINSPGNFVDPVLAWRNRSSKR